MKKRVGLIIGIIMMSSLTGCHTKNKAEIEQSFDKVLALYPTKNIEDFYDMEGYRDSEFDEGDKGVWVLHSSMSISKSEKSDLHSEGMVLRMNRNTRKAKGYYYVRTNWNDLSKTKTKEKYPITYDHGEFKLLENIQDEQIEEKI